MTYTLSQVTESIGTITLAAKIHRAPPRRLKWPNLSAGNGCLAWFGRRRFWPAV
jgi:hypothetical protein